MRWSELYIPTLRDKQSEAELDSHQFLLRGGYIRKLAPGHYYALPLMQRVIAKLVRIVREEFDRTGAREIGMPLLCPSELWQRSGRAGPLGADQMRLRDRRGHDFVLCGSHEEVITSLVAGEVRSYRQLPLRLYQVGPKFRDELRTRFGLMRLREFLMADLHGFDADQEAGRESVRRIGEACRRVFERIGLEVMMAPAVPGPRGAVEADGVDFIAPLDSSAGEETVVVCEHGDFEANAEAAAFADPRDAQAPTPLLPLETVDTPSATTIEQITSFLNVEPTRVVKTLLYMADGAPIAALIRGDRDVSPAKLAAATGAGSLELAGAAQVAEAIGAPVGFAGPVGLKIPIIADPLVVALGNFVVGANQADRHSVNVNPGRDFTPTQIADITLAREGDRCPNCRGGLRARLGLLVGNVVSLGSSIPEALGALISTADSSDQPMILSTGGIGLSRTIQTVLESRHHHDRLIWPPALAPFAVEVMPLNCDNDRQTTLATDICAQLEDSGTDVLLDDRPLRPGVKFHDADLLGIPVRVVIGDKSLVEGKVELSVGYSASPIRVETDRVLGEAKKALAGLK